MFRDSLFQGHKFPEIVIEVTFCFRILYEDVAVFDTGEPTSCEAQACCEDGQVQWHINHAGPIFDNDEVIAVSVVAEDITLKKQAERERDRSCAILNAAIECLPFDFFALGSDGRYMLTNIAATGPYGNIVGKTPQEVCPNEHDLAVWLENNRRAFAGEQVEGEVELAVHGEKRHYRNIITPIRDDDEFYGILGINIDITERVQAEVALQQANDELEQRVKERTSDVSRPLSTSNMRSPNTPGTVRAMSHIDSSSRPEML